MLAGAPGRDAYLAWRADRCIGLASVALDGDGSTHMGVVIEDACQRQGTGRALTAALVGRARQRLLTALTADLLGDNKFILPPLALVGPTTVDP